MDIRNHDYTDWDRPRESKPVPPEILLRILTNLYGEEMGIKKFKELIEDKKD